MAIYKILARKSGLLHVTSDEYGSQAWSKSRLTYKKKYEPCVICGGAVGGHWLESYRPITNLSNRMKRMCMHCAERSPIVEQADD